MLGVVVRFGVGGCAEIVRLRFAKLVRDDPGGKRGRKLCPGFDATKQLAFLGADGSTLLFLVVWVSGEWVVKVVASRTIS
jgi:hypothetical protein